MAESNRRRPPAATPDQAWKLIASRPNNRIALFLDYDGTLTGFTTHPDDAAPDHELLRLLDRLGRSPGIELFLVSGRPRHTMEAWFADLPAHLFAEHAYWRRHKHHPAWQAAPLGFRASLEPARIVFQDACARLPGSWVEEKSVGLAWHYRNVPPRQARLLLEETLTRLERPGVLDGLALLPGDCLLEVRQQAIHKGLAVSWALQHHPPEETLYLAIGDDEGDEFMFHSLPGGGLSFRVRPAETLAHHVLEDFRSVRDLLARLVSGPRSMIPRPARRD